MAIMLRDSHTAGSNFRLNSEHWNGVPKPKFLYFIRFMRVNSQNVGSDWAKGVGVLAKDIDRPKISFDTETLNQYNKKRVVQKRSEFEPINFTFHDTVDNKVLHMFEDYYRFYYGDPRNNSALAWSWDIMAAQMQQGQSGWGFLPPAGSNPNNSYFFSHIELYYMYGKTYSRYDIVNPKVKSFAPSNMSYESSEGAEIQMTMEYEGIVYMGNNMSIESQSGLLQEMGLNASSFYDPRTSSGTADLGSSAQYSKQAGEPIYGAGQLFATNSVSETTFTNAVNRSSSIVDQNSNLSSIFTGAITLPTTVPPDLVASSPTIGDNIAKRMVKGFNKGML